MDPDPVPGGPQAIVTPSDMRDIESYKLGGGRYNTQVVGSFSIHIVDRHAEDQTHRDTFRLTDSSRGLFVTAQNIIDALDMTFLTDAAGNFLTVEPIRHVGQALARDYGRTWEWSGVETRWEAVYIRKYTDQSLS